MISFKKIEMDSEITFFNRVRNECACEYLHDSREFSLEDTKKWIFSLKIPYYIVKKNENYIGYFRISNLSDTNKNVYIGMDLDKNYRGKGLAFDSYTKFIPFLFNLYSLNKISLEVLSTNKIAHNLYIKLGFVVEGVRRQEVYKNGKYVDSIIMSILKSEMLENKIYTK